MVKASEGVLKRSGQRSSAQFMGPEGGQGSRPGVNGQWTDGQGPQGILPGPGRWRRWTPAERKERQVPLLPT